MTRGPSGPHLDGIDLVILDKDGTIIDLRAMWGSWVVDLGRSLRSEIGRPVDEALYSMLGYDPSSGAIRSTGGLAATPMARLRELTIAMLVDDGSSVALATDSVDAVWEAPDPVGQARPIADIQTLFARFREARQAIGIATTDDRDPTVRTLAALGLTDKVDAIVCADDGVAVKPAPDMVIHLCAAVGVGPARTAVVGDAPADLQMARAAGAARVIGVLSGVGTRRDLAPLADVVIDSVADLH